MINTANYPGKPTSVKPLLHKTLGSTFYCYQPQFLTKAVIGIKGRFFKLTLHQKIRGSQFPQRDMNQ